MRRSHREEKKGTWSVLATVLWIVCALVVSARVAGYGVGEVVGSSMEPTFWDGEKFFTVSPFAESVERGDVVVVRAGAKPILKRVVGTPGDEVQFADGVLYVNGAAEEPSGYATAGKTLPYESPVQVLLGEDEYFLLGDNRENSLDSRFDEVGVVSGRSIYGKVVFTKKKGEPEWKRQPEASVARF